MKAVRTLVDVLYVGYLVQVGLMMVVLPWSDAWSSLILRLPPAVAIVLDAPPLRGAITAFGLIHLGFLLLEFRLARRPAEQRGTSR